MITEFKAFETLTMSPDGSQWMIKGRNELGADLETHMMLGSGTTGTLIAQEGQPIPTGAVGEVYDFFGSSPAYFNEIGQYCFTVRARGGVSTIKQKGMFFDGASLQIVREESDPALGLVDLPPNPSGDELFGNSFGSMHVLNDGTFGYQDGTIQNIHSTRRPATFYNDTAFLQAEVTPLEESLWDGITANAFWTTPDGAHWIAAGDDIEPTTVDGVLVVDGQVVLREGSPVAGSRVDMAAVFHTKFLASGDWFARGDDPADNDWAVRNGVLIAATADAVTDGPETWADVFLAFNGNRVGDWVLAGRTTNADPAADEVIVLNGTSVLVREGDPVDLDGNGAFDDDAFIGRGNNTLSAFGVDDVYLTDDRELYFIASLHNGAGVDLGDGVPEAFLRIRICPADLDGSGDVGFGDILAIIGAWGPCAGCPEDLNGNGQVDFADILIVIASWGPC